jgi:hypothetical protein
MRAPIEDSTEQFADKSLHSILIPSILWVNLSTTPEQIVLQLLLRLEVFRLVAAPEKRC